MRAKTILLLLFVVSFGVATLLVLRALPRKENSGTEATAQTEVLVATTPLGAGTLLRAEDVGWHAITGPADPEQFTRPSGLALNLKPELDEESRAVVYGAALRVDVPSGEPLRRREIVKPGAREFLNVVLAPGARAIAIPVVTSGAGTGLLHPGDRVDVMLTQTFKSDLTPLTHRSVGETVVQNLRVLAIDSLDTKQASPGNDVGRAVTLEVMPEQAEKINVAIELGKLSLVLRGTDAKREALVGAVDAPAATSTLIKPTWASDVSPALAAATAPPPDIPTARAPIRVMRGNLTEELQSH
jgi:pilus assembly protein CpaB